MIGWACHQVNDTVHGWWSVYAVARQHLRLLLGSLRTQSICMYHHHHHHHHRSVEHMLDTHVHVECGHENTQIDKKHTNDVE